MIEKGMYINRLNVVCKIIVFNNKYVFGQTLTTRNVNIRRSPHPGITVNSVTQCLVVPSSKGIYNWVNFKVFVLYEGNYMDVWYRLRNSERTIIKTLQTIVCDLYMQICRNASWNLTQIMGWVVYCVNIWGIIFHTWMWHLMLMLLCRVYRVKLDHGVSTDWTAATAHRWVQRWVTPGVNIK